MGRYGRPRGQQPGTTVPEGAMSHSLKRVVTESANERSRRERRSVERATAWQSKQASEKLRCPQVIREPNGAAQKAQASRHQSPAGSARLSATGNKGRWVNSRSVSEAGVKTCEEPHCLLATGARGVARCLPPHSMTLPRLLPRLPRLWAVAKPPLRA
jgi:hypothetical protein